MELKDLYDDQGRLLADADHKLSIYIQVHHQRFHNMLFWANMAILVNMAIFMLRMIRLCDSEHQQLNVLKILMGVLLAVISLFLYRLWRIGFQLGPEEWSPVKTFLHYKVAIYEKQAWMLGSYILAYGLTFAVTYAFYKTTGLVSPKKVLDATSSMSIMMLGLGFYLLNNCLARRAKLISERNNAS